MDLTLVAIAIAFIVWWGSLIALMSESMDEHTFARRIPRVFGKKVPRWLVK